MNHRSLYGILEAIMMLGSLLGAAAAAQKLVDEMQQTLELTHAHSARLQHRPKVYFEEWHDPFISGIGWVGELIELAGGQDIFSHVKVINSCERIISVHEGLLRSAELIMA